MSDRRLAAYLAEFLGTLLLVFFVAMVLADNSQGGLGYTDFAVIGLVHAFLLMVLIYAFGSTSGAHFNPAVTVALAAIRKISPSEAGAYVLFQLAGGTCGALLTKLVVADQGAATDYGATKVSQSFLHGHVFTGSLVEGIGTFMLVLSIMAVAVNPNGPARLAGFVIGSTLGLGVMVFGPLTGAGFNPARAFGPALVANAWDGAGKFLVVYVLGPLIGGVIASVGYKYLVLDGEAPAT